MAEVGAGHMSSIALGERVDIYTVRELQKALLAQLETGNDVVLDAAGVARVDTVGIQLLVVAFNEAKSRDVNIAWTSVPDILVRAAVELGVDEHLKLGDKKTVDEPKSGEE